MIGANPDIFGSYSVLKGKSNTLSEINLAVKYKRDVIQLLDSNYYLPIERYDPFYENPLAGRFFGGVGYVFKSSSLKNDIKSTTRYDQHYISLSYFSPFRNMNHAVSAGGQVGLVKDPSGATHFDFNGGVAILGRTFIRQYYDEGDCELWKDMAHNYIGLSLYNGASPYYSKKDFDTLTSVLARRWQLSFQETFFAIHPFHLVADGDVIYNGSTLFTAGPAIVFDVHHKHYDMVRLGLMYKSSGDLVYSGGIRIYGGHTKTYAMILSINYDKTFSGINTGYSSGWYLSATVLPLVKCWEIISCQRHVKMPQHS